MMGGYVVYDQTDARELTRMLARDPDRALKPGDVVEEPPCQPDAVLEIIRENEGRSCPRVELRPDNLVPAQAVMACLNEHTRPLVAPFMASMGRRARSRVLVALQSAPVVAWLTPKPPKTEPEP